MGKGEDWERGFLRGKGDWTLEHDGVLPRQNLER